ncbi:hypothetical protein [Emticicia agri]|uniref:SGNH/GDSL hydrolase family protein n=1 Tax=Emticicia agri TaxID=2492393 RepID=A0A4V1ZDT8_9BACT|nr:hypothetical protein [Emticicia agri]RYU97310.1 hypothetical protein EWM59_03225 [Emticicia agri]
MKTLIIALLITGLLIVSCKNEGNNPIDDKDPLPNETQNPGQGQPGIIGLSGIEAWDKLSSDEKNKIKSWNTIFMHQSVGGDLEDGANANGFKFEYFDRNEKPDKGLSGNVFSVSNGNPMGKMAEFKELALVHQSLVKIAIFKFGYADINDANLEQVKLAYKKMVDELRTQIQGLRFVHITPPLIYIVTKDDGNAAKMKMGEWMKNTFKDKDVIFELQEIESDNGTCKLGNVWTICNQYRSTTACPSKEQGVDAPEGQGHICEKEAKRIVKALLYSIYQVGK